MTTATRRRRFRRAVERVNDGLHRIRLGGVNAYLLECDDGLVLIDCGVPRRVTSSSRRSPISGGQQARSVTSS